MLYNYLKIAWRHLLKNRVYSLINILGLSLGICAVLLILVYIRFELSYDRHHPEYEHIYRVISEIQREDESVKMASSPPPLAWALKETFPEVAQVTRFLGAPEKIFSNGGEQFYEEHGYYVDSTFLDIFACDFLAGDPETSLDAPFSIVLSETLSQKLFKKGPAESIGQVIQLNDRDFQVKGVFAEPEHPSHIPFNYLLSFNTPGGIAEYASNSKEWIGNNFLYTYAKLHPQASAKDLQAKIPAFLKPYTEDGFRQTGARKFNYLQAIQDIHLQSHLRGEFPGSSSIQYIYMLTALATLILILACINFMNLSTARSSKRAREVGLRKVLGAYRIELIAQFIGESLLLSTLALVMGLVLLELFLPSFERLANRQLHYSILHSVGDWGFIILFLVLVGIMAGSYPAFYLSSFQPMRVLKGKIRSALSAQALRKGLVVFQFTVSVGLISSTLLIVQQLAYVQNKPLGFEKSQKLIIPLRTEQAREQYTQFKNDWTSLSQLAGVSGISAYPGTFIPHDNDFKPQGASNSQLANSKIQFCDYTLADVLNLDIKSGRFFDPAFPADSNRVIINETAARAFGWSPEEALGKTLVSPSFDWQMEVAGVVGDFHFTSLHERIQPLVLLLEENPNQFPYVLLSYQGGQVSDLLSRLQKSWNQSVPNVPFEYQFLDEQFAQQYKDDQRFAQMIQVFTGLAIFIACLGLFGLASFTAEQRQKEVGIRKVLGASVWHIILLMSQETILLILLANAISIPIAYYWMSRWLESFAYRMEISWLSFALTAGMALLIALLTISSQTWWSTRLNPVEVLKDE